jgi:hypothetical protein
MGKLEASISLDIGAGAADDAGLGTGGLRRHGHAAAPAGVTVIAQPVHDQDITGAQQAEGVVQQRRIRARDLDGHRRAGDTAAQQALDRTIHEAPVAPVADRRGLGLLQQLDHLGTDLVRHRFDDVFRHHSRPMALEKPISRSTSRTIRAAKAIKLIASAAMSGSVVCSA